MKQKQTIKLTEIQLREVIRESIDNALRNFYFSDSRIENIVRELYKKPKGTIINFMDVLEELKQDGFIYDYNNKYGYLEAATIHSITKDGRTELKRVYIFPNMNAPSVTRKEPLKVPEDKFYTRYPQENSFEYTGMKFGIKYLDGCTQPFLQKISDNDYSNEIKPSMVFRDGIYYDNFTDK
jgi:hypothetical protein